FFFSSRRRHTRFSRDWSSDVCSSDLVATSLGLGVKQISAGIVHLGIVDSAGNPVLVVLILAITAIATVSVVTGLDKGIKWLSNKIGRASCRERVESAGDARTRQRKGG